MLNDLCWQGELMSVCVYVRAC